MKASQKYDTVLAGIVSGFILPLLIGLIIFAITAHGRTIGEYLQRISEANIVTHAVTLCVFPNIIIFLIFNRLDMLRALRGVLAATIVWAVAVFIIKVI
ncbi:MAG TPA: hypothetical protein VMT63_04465 [Bacteroidales bacterium]|nr:hypothetical protein [Bacteroidales bacterium]